MVPHHICLSIFSKSTNSVCHTWQSCNIKYRIGLYNLKRLTLYNPLSLTSSRTGILVANFRCKCWFGVILSVNVTKTLLVLCSLKVLRSLATCGFASVSWSLSRNLLHVQKDLRSTANAFITNNLQRSCATFCAKRSPLFPPSSTPVESFLELLCQT